MAWFLELKTRFHFSPWRSAFFPSASSSHVSCSCMFTDAKMMLQLCQNQGNCIIHQIECRLSDSDSCQLIIRFPSEAKENNPAFISSGNKKKQGLALQDWVTNTGGKKNQAFPKNKTFLLICEFRDSSSDHPFALSFSLNNFNNQQTLTHVNYVNTPEVQWKTEIKTAK